MAVFYVFNDFNKVQMCEYKNRTPIRKPYLYQRIPSFEIGDCVGGNMPRTDGFDAKMAAAGSQITTLLEDNLMNMPELYALLAEISGNEFKPCDMRKQIQGAIVIPGGDDTLFAMASDMSQCDSCGVARMGLPKMLTCGSCKGYHYCSKVCQKKDWKLAHKHMCTKDIIRRAHFKTTDVCVKILSGLCIDWDTKSMNGENNYVQEHIEKSGYKDYIYVPVYDKKRLCYIPMPLKILSYVESIVGKDVAVKSSVEKVHVKFKDCDCVVLLVPTKVQGCSIMTKESFILLPWAPK